MDIDNFFEKDHHKYNHHNHNRDHQHNSDEHHDHDRHEPRNWKRKTGYNQNGDPHKSRYDHHYAFDLQRQFLEKIRNNPKLKGLLIIFVIAVLGLVVLTLFLLWPLLLSILQFVSENGIQGVIDKIWSGSK